MRNPTHHRNRRIFLRSTEIPFPSSGESGSEYFICPHCGEFWGKILNSPGLESPFFLNSVPCERHGNRYIRGGALLPHLLFFHYRYGFENRTELLQSLPRLVLEQEALRKVDQILLEP